jgi:hypothetical protein
MINTSDYSVSQEIDEGLRADVMLKETREFDALAFELKHYKDFKKSQNSYVEYEIDSIKEDFGEIFRLSNGKALRGTFYKISDGWKATPFYLCKQYIKSEVDLSKSVENSGEAVSYIKQMYEGASSDSVFEKAYPTAA